MRPFPRLDDESATLDGDDDLSTKFQLQQVQQHRNGQFFGWPSFILWFTNQRLRRRRAAIPANPAPIRTKVAGSGIDAGSAA